MTKDLLGELGFGWKFTDNIRPIVDTFQQVEFLTFSHHLLARNDPKVKIVKNTGRKKTVTSRTFLAVERNLKSPQPPVFERPSKIKGVQEVIPF